MAFRLKLGEPVAEGLARVGQEQLSRARHQLEAAPTAETVHETRKVLKRLRATLRLARGILPADHFQRENHRLRDVARLLAGSRDSTVMRGTVAKLLDEATDAGTRAALEKLARQLAETHAQTEAGTDHFGNARDALAKAEKAWNRLDFGHNGFDAIAEGLGKVYRRCRKGADLALSVDADHAERDTAVHEWRKAVQQHWRHMRLLEAAWPQHFAARAHLARELSDILGQAQDLATLVNRLHQREDDTGDASPNGASLSLKRGEAKRIIALARRVQKGLRKAALPRASRLFAEETDGHVHRTKLYWRSACSQHRNRDGMHDNHVDDGHAEEEPKSGRAARHRRDGDEVKANGANGMPPPVRAPARPGASVQTAATSRGATRAAKPPKAAKRQRRRPAGKR